jgi:hypothetical protein
MGGRSDVIIRPELDPRIFIIEAPSEGITAQEIHDTCKEWEQEPGAHTYPYLLDSSGKQGLGGGTLVGITERFRNMRTMFEARKTWARKGNATTTDATGYRLHDSAADFETLGVEPGNWVVNFTDGSICTVMEVVSPTELLTDGLGGGIDNGFDSAGGGDAYAVMEITQCTVSAGNITAVDGLGADMTPIQSSAGVMVILEKDVSAALLPGSGGATAEEVADAVWDEAQADHVATGTVGRNLAMVKYQGEIWISSAGSPGTVIGLNGMPDNPVDNLADAVALAGALNINRWTILQGTFTLTSNLNEWYVSMYDEAELAADGYSLNASIVRGGLLTGITSGYVIKEGGVVEDLSGMTGYFSGVGLKGSLAPSTGRTVLERCHSHSIPTEWNTIDVSTAGVELVMQSWAGPLRITGSADASTQITVGFLTGKCDITDTCSAGTIELRGDCDPVIDGSTGATVLDDTNAVVLSSALLNATALNFDASGTIGQLLNFLRRSKTNKLEEISGNPGTLKLYNDAGDAVYIQMGLLDEDGNETVKQEGVPAQRAAASWPPT